MLGLRVFGLPRITLADQPIRLTRRKAVALLIYLVVTGRPHARETLAELLSDGTDEAQARKHLRNALNDLTGSLGPYLVVTRQSVAFDAALPFTSDLGTLRAALAEQHGALDPGTLRRAAEECGEEFLAGFSVPGAPAFEEWIVREREQLRVLRARAWEALIADATKRGDTTALIADARVLLTLEPWREATHRLLIRALAQTGQRGAALAQYAACCRALEEELGVGPSAETVALHDRLVDGHEDAPWQLPTLTTGFVGREHEVGLLLEHLNAPDCRLLTIVGLGGSGKTSLALQVAHRVGERFADRICFVGLAENAPLPHDDPASATGARRELAASIGRSLDLPPVEDSDPIEQLLAWLQPRSLLLVLDNMEHQLAGVELLGRILERAPRVTLLATSRERLRLRAEVVLDLGGLACPTGADDLERAAASRLFLQEARRIRVGWIPTASDHAQIALFCQLVDGLPLALILGAQALRGLTCAELVERVARGDIAHVGNLRDLPERQRSLRAVLDSTWSQLSAEEQKTLRRIAIFPRRFGKVAAEAVTGATMPQLIALVDRGILSCDATGRYAVHPLVRSYADERLAARPEERTATRANHAAHYLAWAKQHAQELHQTPQARAEFEEERANLRLAWDWAVEQVDRDLLAQGAEGIVVWYRLAGPYAEWDAAFERAIASIRGAQVSLNSADPEADALLGTLLNAQAAAQLYLAQYDRARVLADEALLLAQRSEAAPLLARVIHLLARLARHRGAHDEARAGFASALSLARASDLGRVEAASLWNLGLIGIIQGDYAAAESDLAAGMARYRAAGDRLGMSRIEIQQALLWYERGDYAQAHTMWEHSLGVMEAFGYRQFQGRPLYFLGILHDDGLGDHPAAAGHFERYRHLAVEIGSTAEAILARARLGWNALQRGDLAHARNLLGEVLAEGRERPVLEVIVLALRGLGTLALEEGDHGRAQLLGTELLDRSRIARHHGGQRTALRLLGHASVGHGDFAGAQAAYREALQLDQAHINPHVALETRIDLARVALADGQFTRVAELVSPAADAFLAGEPRGLAEPLLAMLTMHTALQSTGDPRAAAALAAGSQVLQQRASAFADEHDRRRYLSATRVHRALASTLPPTNVPI